MSVCGTALESGSLFQDTVGMIIISESKIKFARISTTTTTTSYDYIDYQMESWLE